MTGEESIGIYGKLPAYGDFLIRNLGSPFLDPWDEWLQHYVAVPKEQLGEQWLDTYLTSPIWRFVMSTGVIDDKVWAGLFMPSVDRVGRYFPISLVRSLPAQVSPVNFLFTQQGWFEGVEACGLMALDGEIDVDELLARVDEVQTAGTDPYQPTSHLGAAGAFVVGLASEDELALTDSLPCLLTASLSSSLSSFSLWQTHGSDLIAPLVFACQGLPPSGGISSMLDGQWQQRDWKIPFNLNAG